MQAHHAVVSSFSSDLVGYYLTDFSDDFSDEDKVGDSERVKELKRLTHKELVREYALEHV